MLLFVSSVLRRREGSLTNDTHIRHFLQRPRKRTDPQQNKGNYAPDNAAGSLLGYGIHGNREG